MSSKTAKLVVLASCGLGLAASYNKNRPVSKVITILKDMLKQLEKEAADDEAIYDKMACWCQTNDKEKTKAIADAEERIKMLTTKVEELTALSARLNSEIKNLKAEVAKNRAALDKATSIREKELAEFNAEEKDMLEAITSLKAAITVLSKHNSFLQMPRASVTRVRMNLQRLLETHHEMFVGVLTRSQKRAATAFIQSDGPDYFDAQPTFKQSYAPQSSEIFGILRQMLETFESNLSASQKEEMANQKAYQELKAAKEEEISAGQAQVEAKLDQLADTDVKNAQAKEDIEDTKKTLSADEQFLMMLKEKCAMTDAEWEERQKTRALETEACSKALTVLSGDDAHDLFTRTFNFVQTSSTSRQEEASELLTKAAKKFGNPRLATLAVSAKLDAFVRVKKAIDGMIADLTQEKADEIKHKDFCVDKFDENARQTERKERSKSDLTAKIDDLTMQINGLSAAIDGLKAEISEMQVQMKRAGEDREKENKEFQTTIADQRETQKILKAALTILKDFYAKAAMVQEPAGPPPPAGFETYKNNAAAPGVVSMIQQIIEDAKAMETEAIKSEEDAQVAYESFVKETNASIEAKGKDIVNKSETKSKAEGDLVETKESKEATMVELEQLSNYNAELHQSCDFLIKNFEVRQTARDEEVEALKQAKAILSGAKFAEFLQSD